MTTFVIEFGALGEARLVPDLTVRTTDPNVLSRTVVDHARPHITPVLTDMGRPELADCLFRTNRDRTMGQFLWLDLATGKAAEFLPARITTTPERIQRKRTAGWTANGAKYVGRGTRWGNPFVVGARYVNRTAFHDAPFPAPDDKPLGTTEHPEWSPWPAWTETVAEVRDRQHAVDLFRAHTAYNDDVWGPEVIRAELAGRDLMCWCPLDQPCHADVLLELAAA
ncbi:DUF4326 domain-containing protein [Streptomyces sp. NPDC002535]